MITLPISLTIIFLQNYPVILRIHYSTLRILAAYELLLQSSSIKIFGQVLFNGKDIGIKRLAPANYIYLQMRILSLEAPADLISFRWLSIGAVIQS